MPPVGNIVLVDEYLSRNCWMLSHMIETFAGVDGLVRTIRVLTGDNMLVHLVHKLSFVELIDITASCQNTS